MAFPLMRRFRPTRSSAAACGYLQMPTSVLAASMLVAGCAVVTGCDQSGVSNDTAKVGIGGKTFFLEVANTDATRFRGLSERTTIAADGGLIFVFPTGRAAVQGFVMRDCPIPIDIIYLDATGRVLAMHAMLPEPPRDPAKGEGTPADTSNRAYDARLKQYSSRFPAQFAIELAGGTIKTLSIKEGDKIELDLGMIGKAR